MENASTALIQPPKKEKAKILIHKRSFSGQVNLQEFMLKELITFIARNDK